jgi:hypothetical protein
MQAAPHDVDACLELLKHDATLTLLVGVPDLANAPATRPASPDGVVRDACEEELGLPVTTYPTRQTTDCGAA